MLMARRTEGSRPLCTALSVPDSLRFRPSPDTILPKARLRSEHVPAADRENHQADTCGLDKRSSMCKLLVWQHPKKSLHSRTHTTSSNEGRRAAHFCGVVASVSRGVMRDFEDVGGLYRSEEAFDGHYWDNQRAA